MVVTSGPEPDTARNGRGTEAVGAPSRWSVLASPSALRSLASRALASGWTPFGCAVAGTLGWLSFYGVSLVTTAMFCGYIVLGIVLPGLLLWRWAHRGSGSLLVDVAAGSAIGYAIEVFVYIPGRAMGLPLLPLLPQIVTIAVFLAVPRLRRYWRGSQEAMRPPVLWSWTLVAVWAIILVWSVRYVGEHSPNWPTYGAPDPDMPFHLALIGDAKHHFPIMTPWVSDEPVLYHWFVYTEMAATSWITGIEPALLLTRLSPLPMLAGFVVLIPMLTRRLTGNWWSGAVALVLAFCALSPNPYGWAMYRPYVAFGFSPYEDGAMFRQILWTSPTQTFATLLFIPLVMVLIDLLDGHGRDARRWMVFTLLTAIVMGAKATFLPLQFAALLLVVAVHLVFRRKVLWPAVAALGITLAAVVFALVALFGGSGSEQGLRIEPLAAIWSSSAPASTGVVSHVLTDRLLALTAVTIFCWICIWAGVVGLRKRLLEPPIVLLLGIGIAGIGAVLLLNQTGGSQGFFLQSARPYLAVAAACGLTLLVGKLNWRIGSAMLATALVGALTVAVIRRVDGPHVPLVWPGGNTRKAAFAMVWPYAALLVVAMAAIVALWFARRRLAPNVALTLVVSLLAGFALFSTYPRLSMTVREGRQQGWREVVRQTPFYSHGTVEASRWLRDHSSPDDLVATNAHCLLPITDGKCGVVHFAIAAYSERRVLVEGWAFTPTAHREEHKRGDSVNIMPYWKPDVLADNDAAFQNPSEQTVGRLRDHYHVKWMIADSSQGGISPDIGRFAKLRYRFADFTVFEVVR